MNTGLSNDLSYIRLLMDILVCSRKKYRRRT